MNKRSYFIKCFIFLLSIIFIDYIIGKGLNYIYFRQSQGKLYNLTYTIEQQTADILIMGSSRAMHQYNPDIITDSLGLSCFNAGYDGQSILYHMALFDVITKRYNPKIIILDVNTNELNENKESYDLLATLNPYVNKYPVLWEILSLKSPFERIKHYSKIYPYNSLFARIVIGNFHFKTRDVSVNGFTAQYNTWNEPIEEITYSKELLDKNKMNLFNRFLFETKKRGITVYVVLSPIFGVATNNSPSIDYIIDECKRNNVIFISYQNNENFYDKKLFNDPGHLNYLGADYFSSDISYLLWNYLSSSAGN